MSHSRQKQTPADLTFASAFNTFCLNQDKKPMDNQIGLQTARTTNFKPGEMSHPCLGSEDKYKSEGSEQTSSYVTKSAFVPFTRATQNTGGSEVAQTIPQR